MAPYDCSRSEPGRQILETGESIGAFPFASNGRTFIRAQDPAGRQ
jgi:hypothetical protein